MGLIIEAILHAPHCFRLPMRINRELSLYLGFEANETLSPQHGSCHMGLCSQPTWHLLHSTPAKDTHLLPPIMLTPYLTHRSLLLSYTRHYLHYYALVIWLCYSPSRLEFGYFVMMYFSKLHKERSTDIFKLFKLLQSVR